MRKIALLAAFPIASVTPTATAQSASTVLGDDADFGVINRDPLRWPSPEVVANELRSGNEKDRVRGLELMGFKDDQVHRPVWSQSTPLQIVDSKVVSPDLVQLSYTALGDPVTRQAILAVFVDDLQATQLAVAAPVAGGWERIAVLSCWCKYEMNNGTDALSEFMQLQPVPVYYTDTPQRFELVVRASGGGTGIYDQTESHFRVLHNELRKVLSFTSRHRNCDSTASPPTCTLERRWFYSTQLEGGPGGLLVEESGSFPEEEQSSAFWSVRDLEIRDLRPVRCTRFMWNPRRFTYEQVGAAASRCAPAPN